MIADGIDEGLKREIFCGGIMVSFEFYFDYRSPYSYLAHTQFERLPGIPGFHPFDIRDVMQLVGNVPTSVVCEAKNKYVKADLQRWVKYYGVPFRRRPDIANIDARRLLRATISAGPANSASRSLAAGAIMNAMWRDSFPLKTVADICNVFSKVGIDGAAFSDLIDDPVIDNELNSGSAAAAERGVFGAPTFIVGSDLYFGNDRIDFLKARLESGK